MTIENAKGNDFRVEDIEGQIKRGRIEVESKVYKEFLISILNRIKSSVNIKNYDCIFLGGGSVNNININSNKQYVPTESKISNEKEEDLTSISDDNSKALDEEMASFFVD